MQLPHNGIPQTAGPFAESSPSNKSVKDPVFFKNIIYDYPLSKAMEDGYVKEPAVVTQKNFDPSQFNPEQLERIKLEDGIRVHEATKVELETYARQNGKEIVKPFILVIARDTTHAAELKKLIESDCLCNGNYNGKVIQVDSSQSGEEKEENVERLLAVEKNDEPTEIIIHVNMLKEGWDVTNLYTIIPLRVANAHTLVESRLDGGCVCLMASVVPYREHSGFPQWTASTLLRMINFRKSSMRPTIQIRPFTSKPYILTKIRIFKKQKPLSPLPITSCGYIRQGPPL
ncbi:MAG: hypothetical protein LBL07_01720 [Tannerella sp.]|nr:hypothetical protein [Tannerella sp.]